MLTTREQPFFLRLRAPVRGFHCGEFFEMRRGQLIHGLQIAGDVFAGQAQTHGQVGRPQWAVAIGVGCADCAGGNF